MKGEGKKGMILSCVREREGVEGGRDGEMGRGITRVEIKIGIRRERRASGEGVRGREIGRMTGTEGERERGEMGEGESKEMREIERGWG